jgi:hypothetical protein
MFVKARYLMLAGVLSLMAAGSLSAAQRRQPPPAPAPAQAPEASVPAPPQTAISAGQIQRWFEAFTVLQAQEALNLSEAQYGRFVTRLKALQDSRRKHQVARNQIMGDLRKLTNPQTGSNDEASLVERLKTLRDEDDRAAADLKRAYDGVDETLDTRQQARFRIFEERMEQQKLELLMRTRQNARAAQRGRGKS